MNELVELTLLIFLFIIVSNVGIYFRFRIWLGRSIDKKYYIINSFLWIALYISIFIFLILK